MKDNYLDWSIGPPYRMNSVSIYESFDRTISSFSSLFWLSLNCLRVWISPYRYCFRFVVVDNEAWHLLFKVRNFAWVDPCKEKFVESFEFDDPSFKIICKIFCWHTNSWLNLSHHMILNSLEREGGKERGCSCFLKTFQLRIHGILNLE